MQTEFFQDFFHYGASVAPYAKSTDWDMADWDFDLARMKSLNFTTARIFIAWDRIEIRKGEYDWSKPDYFLKCAEKHGIRVIMNVGGVFTSIQGIYPPRYLRKEHFHPRQATPDTKFYNDGPLFTICMDNEVYHEKALDFIARTVKRYAEHPAVCGWMSWNEPCGRFCYCPATVARFRNYLKEKYRNNISELNKVWGTEFPVDYRSFDELNPPSTSGFIGGLNPSVDWFEFAQENMMRNMESVYRTIKANDSRKHPVTGNLCFGQAAEAITVLMIPERFRRCFDIAGFSYYTVCEHREGNTNLDLFRIAVRLEANRWVSGDPLKRTLVLETEAGGNRETITPERRRFNNYIAIGHNAKSIILWNYRTRISDNQVGNFNLMAWDGTETARARTHAGMAAVLHRYAKLLNTALPISGKAAILYDNRIRRAAAVSKSNDWAETRWEGAAKLLWDLNIPIDGWMPEQGALDPEKYNLLLIPAAEFMNEEIAIAISNYVRNGGTVIAETPFAFKDMKNLLHKVTPNYGLDEVFGLKINDREGMETAPLIDYPSGKAPVYFFWSRCLCTTAKPLVQYEDGSAFLTENHFGKGRAILAGTEVFSQYIENPQTAASVYLQKLVLNSRVVRNAVLRKDGMDWVGSSVEVSHLEGPDGEAVFLANYNKNDTVSFCAELACGNEGWINMESGEEVDLKEKITLPPLGVFPLVRVKK